MYFNQIKALIKNQKYSKYYHQMQIKHKNEMHFIMLHLLTIQMNQYSTLYYVYDILDMDFLIYIRQSLIHFEVSNDAFCWHISDMTEIKYDPFFVSVSQMTNKTFYQPSSCLFIMLTRTTFFLHSFFHKLAGPVENYPT